MAGTYGFFVGRENDLCWPYLDLFFLGRKQSCVLEKKDFFHLDIQLMVGNLYYFNVQQTLSANYKQMFPHIET